MYILMNSALAVAAVQYQFEFLFICCALLLFGKGNSLRIIVSGIFMNHKS
jgi:hypothetical protein